MKQNIVLLHIPHSSTKLTKEFKALKKIASEKEINKFNLTITDLFTDKLFSCHKFKNMKFKYSRICCDVEKFSDDEKEIMSKFGMGVVYSKTNTGTLFAKPNQDYKKLILEKYYYKYHQKFEKKVKKILKNHKKLIIIDCHSFSKNIILHTDIKDLPDICIGFNDNFINPKVIDFTKEYFENLGYSTAFNYPYSGSFIPNNTSDDANIISIMLEINKRIYLDDENKTLKNFKKLKKDICGYLKRISNFSIL